MTKQTLNIIHAVRDYKRWTVSNNMAEPREDFDWYNETKTYYFSFKLPEDMEANYSDFERILQLPQYTLDYWDGMEEEELKKEKWK